MSVRTFPLLAAVLISPALLIAQVEAPAVSNQPKLDMVGWGLRGVNRCLAFSPDGRTLAVGVSDTVIGLWDVAASKELRRFEGHRGVPMCVAFAPDGRLLASGASYGDETIRLWQVDTGRPVRILGAQPGGVTSLAWSPDGKQLASVGGSDVRLWDVSDGSRVGEWRLPAAADCVAFSPDGALVASAHGDGTVRVWDCARRFEVWRLRGHKGAIRSLAFAVDGRTLASGGVGDGTICLWEVATGKRRSRWEVGGAPFTLAFAPKGRLLASADGGAVSLWDTATGRGGAGGSTTGAGRLHSRPGVVCSPRQGQQGSPWSTASLRPVEGRQPLPPAY